MRFKKKQEKEPGVYRVSGVPSFFLQIFWVYLGFFFVFLARLTWAPRWRRRLGTQNGGRWGLGGHFLFLFLFFFFFLLLLLSSPLFRWKKPKEEEIYRSLSLSLLIFFSFRFFFQVSRLSIMGQKRNNIKKEPPRKPVGPAGFFLSQFS